MVRRPYNWNEMNQEERMKWLRKQRTETKGGRRVILKKEDAPRIWSLMKKYDNQSMVADLVGVDRTTLWRFLKKFPMPKTFILKDDAQVTDYPEIQVWSERLDGFLSKSSKAGYLGVIRKFYEFMKEKHPDRAKPSLWTSDYILEFIYKTGIPKGSRHFYIVPLRSLALKARTEFPHIDLGLLPTKKTHKAKRSLAGHKEYYYTQGEVDNMITVATTRRAKALIAFLYNTACRTLALTNARNENLNLEQHSILIKDKGPIWWDCWGLTDKTCQLLSEYLEERGYPKTGWLFVNINGNGKETKMTKTEVNNIIKELGEKAEITDKILTAKAFRKSFVENFFQIPEADPMILAGSGKGTEGQPKTAFGVGWSLKVLMEHYAPKMKKQIDKHRQKFQITNRPVTLAGQPMKEVLATPKI